jgi:hypothetical protein
MRTARPHVAVKINAANETAKISRCAWMVHMQDCLNFLFPMFKATWCELITQPVRFLDGPFAFDRINIKNVVAKAMQDSVKQV